MRNWGCLAEKIKNLGSKPLVSVESLAFSVSMAKSSTKTRLPLTVHVKTFEGSNKEIQVLMNFRRENDSLALASTHIVESLFGTSHSRRRRSVEQEFRVANTKDNASFLLEENKCLFAHEAHIFFADIFESLDLALKSKRNFEEALSAGIRSLQGVLDVKDSFDHFSSGPWQQNGTSFSAAVIKSLNEAVQLDSSGMISPNKTLDDVRGFLDILSQEKNFTKCSGVQDCTDFFFGSLEEMYQMEYHPRAIEIKSKLRSLEMIVGSILRENHGISTLEDMTSQAKILIKNSTDDIILCGKKPEMERNSPVHVIVLLGETARLVCEAKSILEVEYVWIKDDKQLDETNITILELQNVTDQSEGAYKCQASNRRGSVVSNVTIVEVYQRPNITEEPLDAQVLVGDEIFSMICNSTGVPRPSTQWFFIPIKTEKQEVTRINTTSPLLQLANLSSANAGFYYCKVSNLHGTVQSRVTRLDVLRFVPGVPRIAVNLKLNRCLSAASSVNNKSNCEDNATRKFLASRFCAC